MKENLVMEHEETEENEPKLLESLGIDEELWRSVTPVKKSQDQQKYTPRPVPVPASHFKSLRNHTPTHSRNTSMNSAHFELMSSPIGQDESFVSFKSGDEFQKQVEVNNQDLRYSVYVSNEDFEVPEYYQTSIDNQNNMKKRGKNGWLRKFNKNGHSNSISSIFTRKDRLESDNDAKHHTRGAKSTSNVDINV